MSNDILILGLGNELLADDGIGVIAVRVLKERFSDKADIIDTAESGMALLDYFIGYKKAIIIDAINTENGKPGKILELDPDDLDSVIAPSPHYAGLPEIWKTAKQLELDFPGEIKIFAVEVGDPYTIGGKISPEVHQAIPELVRLVESRLDLWK